MNNFIFENKTKVSFGKGGVKEYLGGLLANFGETVMLAYGGGSIKRNGVYDEIMGILNAQGKCVVEFSGIMSNPTYAKVQDGAKLARASAMAENGVLKIGKVTDFQCHMQEHQLGAYTDCNHGAGLAVIHPVLYRHIYKSGTARFTRWAQNGVLLLNAVLTVRAGMAGSHAGMGWETLRVHGSLECGQERVCVQRGVV